MKEPGRTNAAAIVAAFVMAWMLCAPQALIAQRPYPPPKANMAPTQPHATPIGGNRSANGGPESSRNGDASDITAMLLRRRLAAELAEDFDRLGRINREKIVPLSSSTPIYDYKELAQTAGGINKRAKRIKSNCPLLLKEKKVEKTGYTPDVADVGTLLPELSRLIESFLSSTVFRITSVNDDELRSTTGRDLEGIIRLSDTINKIAKRLAKASTRSA